MTFLRHAGASLPCPLTDITGGFNQFLAQAYGLPPTATAIQQKFGSAFGEDLEQAIPGLASHANLVASSGMIQPSSASSKSHCGREASFLDLLEPNATLGSREA